MHTMELGLKLLSPGFCGGADRNEVELRAPSIRGHLRRWHTRLFNEHDMQAVWGSVGKNGGASKIQLRVETFGESVSREVLLPHKNERGGVQNALACEFNVLLASRDTAALERAEKALRLWSLLGAIGTRANRAAGSVWPMVAAPANADELGNALKGFGLKKVDVRISTEFDQPARLREAASDTLQIGHLFGSASPRKESPLKIKLVEFGSRMHLLLWAEQPGVLDSALAELGKKGKPLAGFEWKKTI